MAVFLDFLRCAEHQSYCGKHNLVFTLSCMPLQPNNRRTKWPRNSHYTPNIQNVSVGAATNIVQPMTFSVAMALVEHSILLKCWAKIGISGAIGVSRMPLTQRQRVNIQRNLTVAGLPYWRLSMAALLRIADRVGLRAKRPQLAGKGLMGFSLQTCHPVNATVAIGQRGGIRAVGQKRSLPNLL